MSVVARPQSHKSWIDLEKNELRNARLQNLGADTASPVNGLIIYRSDTHEIRAFIDGAWRTLATMDQVVANGIPASIVDAKGDIIVATGDNTVARKPAGTNGHALFADSAQTDGLSWRAIGQSDVVGLTAALAAKQNSLSVTDTPTLDLTLSGAALSGDVLDSPTVDGQTPAQLRDRSSHTGTQAISTITGLQTALDDKVGIELLGVANGVATLDAGGKIPSGQLPPVALSDVFVVATIDERDDLTVQAGDIAIVTGTNQTFIYDGTAWREIVSPVDGVQSVLGGTGITSTGGLNPTISITPQGVGTTELADDSVTADKIATDVAGNGLTGGGGSALAVNPGTGLEISSDAVRIASSAAGNGLTGGGGSALAVGAGNGITVTATEVAVDTSVVTRKATAIIGDGAATSFTITHNLNTKFVNVTVFENAGDGDEWDVEVKRPTVNTVQVVFTGHVPTTDQFGVLVTG